VNSDADQFVQSMTLIGRARAESGLPESFVTRGGRIVVQLKRRRLPGAAPVDH